MAGIDNLKPFVKGDPRRINKPKGAIHLSTRIQRILEDDDFVVEEVVDGKKVQFKGNPAEAIIRTAIIKAKNGDKSWADWLANNGYGSMLKVQVDDSRKEILARYMGGEDVGQTQEIESGPSTDSA